jgi:hypothetical protein
MFGFFLGSIGVYFIGILRRSTEDYNKVTSDEKFLSKRKYAKCNLMDFDFNGIHIHDYFFCCYAPFIKKEGKDEVVTKKIKIIDDKTKSFELDDIIANNFFTLMKSHGSSYKQNGPTVRLDDCKVVDKQLVLTTSRSTYFKHLVTNRAIDCLIEGNMSLRDIYEPGPELSPLNESKMSNHIGVNIFVTTECGGKNYLILPKRGKNSTISKGLVTSSIASRLIINDSADDLGGEETIPFSKQVFDLVRGSLGICDQKIAKLETKFLGMGRNLYEGGKPQFYYWIKLPRCVGDPYSYFSKWVECKVSKDQMDADTGLIFVDMSTLKYLGNDTFKAYKSTSRGTKRTYFTVEKSFLANLFLYNGVVSSQRH